MDTVSSKVLYVAPLTPNAKPSHIHNGGGIQISPNSGRIQPYVISPWEKRVEADILEQGSGQRCCQAICSTIYTLLCSRDISSAVKAAIRFTREKPGRLA